MSQSTPKYVLVENQIRDSIKRHEFSGKIPGERVLSRNYGFSYMTIRKAIDNLVTQGILYKIPARGTFVVTETAAKPEAPGVETPSLEPGRSLRSASRRAGILKALEKKPGKTSREDSELELSRVQNYLRDLRKVELVQSLQINEGSVVCFATAIDGVCDQLDCVWRKDCFALARKRRNRKVSTNVEMALEFLRT